MKAMTRLYPKSWVPSNKGQRMMVIKGNGGEGKSQIGAVLSMDGSERYAFRCRSLQREVQRNSFMQTGLSLIHI